MNKIFKRCNFASNNIFTKEFNLNLIKMMEDYFSVLCSNIHCIVQNTKYIKSIKHVCPIDLKFRGDKQFCTFQTALFKLKLFFCTL